MATLLTLETLKWEYSFATGVFTKLGSLLSLTSSGCAGRFGTWRLRYTPFRDIFNSVHSHFGTCHIGISTIRDCTTALFQVTMYRQFARKVSPSANSSLIRYYLLRLWLSMSTLDHEWTNRLVMIYIYITLFATKSWMTYNYYLLKKYSVKYIINKIYYVNGWRSEIYLCE